MQQEITDIVLQSSVNVEKRNQILQNVQTMFEKFSEWDTLNNSIVVTSRDDIQQTKLAKQARITVKKARTDGEKYFDSKRSEVQALKAEYDAEDKLYLRLKQAFSSMCKEREAALEEKELYIEKIIQKENELRNMERYNQLLQYTETPQIYSYEELDDVLFKQLLDQLESAKAISLRLKKEAEENLKRVNAMKSRLIMLAQYIPNFYSLDFESMTEAEAEQIFNDANTKREDELRIQKEKEAELEALRLERAKDELAMQRLNDLQQYKYGLELLSDTVNLTSIRALNDVEYADLFATIVRLHKNEVNRLEAENKEKERKAELLKTRQQLLSNLIKYIPGYFDYDLSEMDDIAFGDLLRNAEEQQRIELEEQAKVVVVEEPPIITPEATTEREEITNIITSLNLLKPTKEFSEKGSKTYRIFVNSVELLKKKGLELIRETYGTES